jgi:hypothetical protein
MLAAHRRRAGQSQGEALEPAATAEEAEARYWARRRANEARLARAMAELGATEEARLRWLIALTARPLRRLSDDDWAVLDAQLRYLAPHHPDERQEILPWPPVIPGKSARRMIAQTVKALAECLGNFADKKGYICSVPAGQREFAAPQRRGNGRTRAVIGSRFFVRGPAALIHAAVDLLEHVGADRLKRCPFEGSSNSRDPSRSEPPCKKLFLADHRNKEFCTKRHASRTAYLKWWRDTMGGTRAKQ